MSDTNIAPSVLKACPFCGSDEVFLQNANTTTVPGRVLAWCVQVRSLWQGRTN